MNTSTILDALQHRYAVKRFDPTKKVSEEYLQTILEAGRLAPSSLGLQPFDIIVVKNPEIRKELLKPAMGQSQITDASHLIVFSIKNVLTVDDVDAAMERIAAARNIDVSSLAGFRKSVMLYVKITRFVRWFPGLAKWTPAGRKDHEWAAKQAYISLGFMLETAALLGVDACPMGGFMEPGFNKALGLRGTGYHAEVALAIGYHAEDDKYAHLAKMRRSSADMIRVIE